MGNKQKPRLRKKRKQEPPAVQVEYTVDRITNSRISPLDNGFDYLVHWREYADSDDTWEPWEAVRHTDAYMSFRYVHLNDRQHFFPPSEHREYYAWGAVAAEGSITEAVQAVKSGEGDEVKPGGDGDDGEDEEDEDDKDYQGEAEDSFIPARPRRPFPSTPTPTPTPSIDVHSSPHILSQIISHSSGTALTTLMCCSKQLFHLVIPHLYRNLRMDIYELEELFENGILAGSASTSIKQSSSGPVVSETARAALQQVRSLTYLRHRTYEPLCPPPGCMTNVESVQIHITPRWYPNPSNSVGLKRDIPPPPLVGVPARCVVRLPDKTDNQLSFSHPQRFWNVPESIVDVTLLVPGAGHLLNVPRCSFVNPETSARTFTIVLLPSTPPVEGTARKTLSKNYWLEYLRSTFTDVPNCNIRIVGAEYMGIASAELLRIWKAQPSKEAELRGNVLSAISFDDYLYEQEVGAIFTGEEEAELRVADRQLMLRMNRVLAPGAAI